MHQLARNKKQGWHCKQCHCNRILSSQVLEQICPGFDGNKKSIPALATRKKLWKQWYNDAHSWAQVDPAEAPRKRKIKRIEVTVAKQAKWDETAAKAPAPSSRFSGLLLQKSDRSKDTWWRCPFCDFSIAHGASQRSDLKSRHLRKVHQSPSSTDNCFLTAIMVFAIDAFQVDCTAATSPTSGCPSAPMPASASPACLPRRGGSPSKHKHASTQAQINVAKSPLCSCHMVDTASKKPWQVRGVLFGMRRNTRIPRCCWKAPLGVFI